MNQQPSYPNEGNPPPGYTPPEGYPPPGYRVPENYPPPGYVLPESYAPPGYAPPGYPAPNPYYYNPYPPALPVQAAQAAPPEPIPPEPEPTTVTLPPETARRGGAGRALLLCASMTAAAVILAAVCLMALGGISFERSPNGALTVFIGQPEVTPFTHAPAPGAESVYSQSPPDSEPSDSHALPAAEVYRMVSPGVVGILASGMYGSSSGTGMVIRNNGYILTNEHVISAMSEIVVVFPDGSEHNAKLIGSDYLSDIAVLKVELNGLNAVDFGSSDRIVPGDSCYAIGNPLGLELQNTFTNGIISAIGRDITLTDNNGRGDITMTVLQTNCAVNPGNSGGPLINERGEVIGIVSSKIMGDYSAAVEGLSFAIPMDTAVPIINDLLEYGRVRGRPVIGITADLNQLTEEQSAAVGVPYGVLISSVTEGTDAYRQGIRPSDIVTHVEGIPVSSVAEINAIKNKFKAGDSLRMTVYHRQTGETKELDIILGEAE